jgi:hypothetical protein
MTYEQSSLLVKALTQSTFLLAGIGAGTLIVKITDLLI